MTKKNGFVSLQALKKTSTGQNKNRDQQFKKIAKLRVKYDEE